MSIEITENESVTLPQRSTAEASPEVGSRHDRSMAWITVLRPRQWVKNAFILAPLMFSGHALEWTAQWHALATLLAFCALASGVYVFNDVIDRDQDRMHPVKCRRPIAAGLISPATALVASLLLVSVAVAACVLVSPQVGVVALTYLALNALYSFRLKRMVIVDVFAISSFFILRLLAGAAAVAVRPSLWLLLCGGLLALYLGFAKRRAEIELLGTGSADHRAVLAKYNVAFLDQISIVLLAVTIVSYIMYTVESETAKATGTNTFSYSTVFVLYGVFRYLYLVQKGNGGNPAETLLTDRALLVNVALWVVYCGFMIYRPT